MFQSGSVWNSNKISLTNPFDFWFNVYLGCYDANGADGIVFILQPISTSIGSSGEGMGFAGVSPSIGIPLDTYQNFNLNDPPYDHISIQANGIINHNSDLAGPVPISATSDNVEDCQWHKLRISWDPATKWLRAYFDGALRVEKQIDLIGSIFNNDPNVYWGFAGATGGSVNLQQFCTALNPDFGSNFSANVGCIGQPIQFSDQSVSFAPITNYNWNFGDGTTSTVANPPSHNYSQPGNYLVSLKIKGQDGCENDTTKNILIASLPAAAINVFDTCFAHAPRLALLSGNYGVNYLWSVDGTTVSTDSTPVLSNLPAGTHNLKLVVSSAYNCGAADSASQSFIIKPSPQIDANVSNGCVNTVLPFYGSQKDNATTIDQWNWSFGDQSTSNIKDPLHAFNQAGQYSIKLWANADNGCTSDTLQKTSNISAAYAFAGNDTVVVKNLPFQLHAVGNGSFQWSPSYGLSNDTIADPVAILPGYQNYSLTVTTIEGCVATDTIHIKAIDGPTVYVPSAFTPNGDGLNDVLRPVYVGITKLESFMIYDRWGDLVFKTSDMSKGWDGTNNKKELGTDTYVWLIQAENYLKQHIVLKGTVTIIR